MKEKNLSYIVQICNIFECTMDDLINDNITDIESIERKSKNNNTRRINTRYFK